jgi:helicase
MSEINPLLSEVNPHRLEKIASAKARGICIETCWEELSEQAQELLQQVHSRPEERLEELFDSATAQPFTAAARTLDAASQWMPARDKSDRAQQKRIALSTALSYAALGNFPSASAVLKRAFPTLRPTSTSQAVLMALAAPALLEEIERHNAHDDSANAYFESLRSFLKSGQDFDVVQSAYLHLSIDGKDDLNGLGAICLQQIFTLSTAHVLRDKTSLSDAYIRRLASHVPLFMPPQWQLLQEGLLKDGNAIVSLPPGTGKTLLGELCLMHSVDHKPGLGVFLAPYVALGRQVARRLEKHLPPTVRVCRALAGGELSNFQPHQRTEILVATPEKLDGLLRAQPHLWEHLKIVVCDEAHLIGGDARGARLEGLLTRLRLQQSTGHSLRLVLLSAFLAM